MGEYGIGRSHPARAGELEPVEHERLIAVLRRLHAAVEAGQQTAADVAAVELHAVLHAHVARDGQGRFAELRRSAPDPTFVERFEDDHLLIHDLLDQLAGPGWRDHARRLVARLIVHIARKESDLYPVAHQFLVAGQWRSIEMAGRSGWHAGTGARQ